MEMSHESRGLKLLWTIIAYAVVLLMVFPVIWMVVSGFKSESQAYATPPVLFFVPILDQFKVALDSGFSFYLLNSLIASLISTAIALLLGIPAAYSMVFQMRKKRSDDFLFFVLSTRFMPFAAIIVPLYIIVARIQLLDNILALVLIYAAMNLPLLIWMAHSYFMDLPDEVIESASIDGCSAIATLWRVAVPMATPGLAAAALLAIIFAWNDFFFAVALTYTRAATLPIMVSVFMSNQSLFLAKVSALATLIIIVPVAIGLYAQKYLVHGLTSGSLK